MTIRAAVCAPVGLRVGTLSLLNGTSAGRVIAKIQAVRPVWQPRASTGVVDFVIAIRLGVLIHAIVGQCETSRINC